MESKQGPARGFPEAGVVYVLGTSNETSGDLVDAFGALGVPATLVDGPAALGLLGPGDVAVARLDVLQTLDGVEPGLIAVLLLERRGIRVVNSAAALLGAHDKLRTARLLFAAGIPHPRTALHGTAEARQLAPPLVVKPRFGSWGRDVYLCRDRGEVERALAAVAGRPWFRRHGALLQEYVEAPRRDLRVLVAAGDVVGAAERTAAGGEWRTNVSIGGTLAPVRISSEDADLAVAAVEAVGGDFMGADLIPAPGGGHLVLEVNAAAEFDSRYCLDGRDVFAEIAERLGLVRERAAALA
jgi:[lysine-biosynthesis-protein LysW]---L-2-aminoadipate ligase